jgi:hypothetical protein
MFKAAIIVLLTLFKKNLLPEFSDVSLFILASAK